MDLHLKQWTRQDDESEEEQPQQYPSLKIPKLLQDHTHQQQQQLHLHTPNTSKISNLSALTRMGGNNYFSLAQWQELELQALIYRYMLAGATVPSELLQPIKKSTHLQSSPFFFHHPLQHYNFYQPSLLQTGYWGRAAMDPEPGRCRRTDGKKWRCSRDVVPGQKYCERHVHRGRNRSRKPVETPSSTIISTTTTPTLGTTGVASALNTTTFLAAPPSALVADGSNSFSLSVHSPSLDVLHFNHSSLDSKIENKSFLGGPHQNEVSNRSDGHVLRHFFDDWPRSLEKPDNPPGNNGSAINSSTCLSISMPGNSSSDVSLKLATGITGDEPGPRDNGRDQPPVGWTSGWASAAHVASMGGPLAEALRSSTSSSSPTSVLHQMPRGSGSETSYVSS